MLGLDVRYQAQTVNMEYKLPIVIFTKSYLSLNGLKNIAAAFVYIPEDQNVKT